MKNSTFHREDFLDAIKHVATYEGWKVADAGNKRALELGKIDLDTYRAAAHLILDAYFEQNP